MAGKNEACKAARQLSFFEPTSLGFGGTLLKNSHARTARPINTKQALHVVLKSELAVGSLAMTRKSQDINGIIAKQSKVFGVTTSKLAIASNHIHLLVYASRRRRIIGWLRAVSGLIARLMLKAEKGSPSKLSFWTYRPFTRVVFWGVDFCRVLAYLEQNILQATGFFPIPQATSSG